MKRYDKTFAKIVFAIIAASLFFSSCGQEKEDESKNQEQQEQEKALKTLEEIDSMNESIIQLLQGPASPGDDQAQKPKDQESEGKESEGKESEGKESEGQESEGKESEGQESEGKESEGQESEGKESEGKESEGQESEGKESEGQESEGTESEGTESEGQESEGQESEGKESEGQESEQGQKNEEQESQKVWDDVNKNIIALHTLFNEYIPAAAKLGASTELSSNANNALNQLTKEAEAKNHNKVLTEANNLQKSICDYYVLHQDKRAPAKLLLFHARGVMLAAKVGDWQTADTAMNELKNMWNTQKTSFAEKEKDAVAKLDLSVSDLTGATADKNQNLVAIKGLIVLQNISELEKSLEEK